LVKAVFVVLKISETIVMEVHNLDWVSIAMVPFGDRLNTPTIYPIIPSNGLAHLGVSHTCPPLIEPRNIGDEDKDFRFHYMLLAQLPSGKSLEDMPAPKIKKFSGLGDSTRQKASPKGDRLDAVKVYIPYNYVPHGCNCASCRGLKRPFNLDKFMSAASSPPPQAAGHRPAPEGAVKREGTSVAKTPRGLGRAPEGKGGSE
jgi:hypothetical protein